MELLFFLEGFLVFSFDFFAFWDFLINFESIVSFQKNILSDCEYLVVHYTHTHPPTPTHTHLHTHTHTHKHTV